MANLIRQISKVVTPQGGTQTTSSYPIGALGSNIQFDSSENFKTNTYLPYFNTETTTVARMTDSISKVNQNIINKLSEVDERENIRDAIQELKNQAQGIKNDEFTDLIDNLTTSVSSLNDISTTVDSHSHYLNSLVNNSSTRLSLTNPWGQNIYLNSVATSSANATSSMAGGNSLGQLAGKFNYVRSHPFIVIRYRYKDLTLTKNTPVLVTFGKKAVEEILVPDGNVLKSVSTSSINLDNYILQVAFSPQVSVGNASAKTTITTTATTATKSTSTTSFAVVPQRSFIQNNANNTQQYVCAGAWSSGTITVNLNVRVIATLKQ